MIAGEGTEVIRATPEECRAFVLDLDRYKQADRKLGTIKRVEFEGNRGEVTYTTRFRGLPGPPVTHTIELDGEHDIDVRSKPDTFDGRLSAFHGWFTFEDLGDGTTRVTHREELHLEGPARLLEGWLGSWLEQDTPDEVVRMKALLEASTPG